MRIDELPKRDRIEDRRGGLSGIPGGRGGLGIGTIVILGLIGWAVGIDPRVLIEGAETISGNDQAQQQSDAGSTTGTGAPSDAMGEFVSAVLGSTEAQWTAVFAQAGKRYEPPTLVMFSGATKSGCGFAQAAMGPFYCPIDRKVYLDTSFFQDLERRFRGCDVGSKTCQFSHARSHTPGRTGRFCCQHRNRGSAAQGLGRSSCPDRPSGQSGNRTDPLRPAQIRSRTWSLRKTLPELAARIAFRLEQKRLSTVLPCCRVPRKRTRPWHRTAPRCSLSSRRLIVVGPDRCPRLFRRPR